VQQQSTGVLHQPNLDTGCKNKFNASGLNREIIVNFCPLTKFDGGLLRLHEADEATIDWLTTNG